MKTLALGLIWFYQKAISPLTPSSCRYQPTCSQYGYEAISKHGFLKGGWLTSWRIMRCHPFAKGGFDPVP
ncbi:MAG: membrane protein insertion efficiency factor YidD [Chloroflexi bacterium]|nr:membrane protein insertion efficiency factor YidD [Chloroflexota bacterium]